MASPTGKMIILCVVGTTIIKAIQAFYFLKV